MSRIFSTLLILTAALAACGSPVPTLAPTSTPYGPPTIVTAGGYRPLQVGDVVEGQTIAYQYFVPTPEQPTVVFAFGSNLVQLFSIKMELSNGIVAYFQELSKYKNLQGFDENDPNQTQPKLITWDSAKPIEIAFIYLPDKSPSHWSTTEGENNETYAAYKIVRRKDGGLRFIDAYSLVALNSWGTTVTGNGGGGGLMFSSRLALLRLILSDPLYQRGENVFSANPPALKEYDPRILKLDPSKTGLAMNLDWVIISRPGPNPGQVAP